MLTKASGVAGATSFYDPVDESQRETLLGAYLDFLVRRDGSLDRATGTLPLREANLEEMNSSELRSAGQISQADFDRLYAKFSRSAAGLNAELLLLLALCKMNAAEAYGVRVVRPVYERRHRGEADLKGQVIQYAQEEEEYHTRILVGSAKHFDIQVEGPYFPKPALKMLIHSLAYAPQPLFHPILYGSELAGVYLFNWTLNHVGEFVKGQPELQEALEQRLVEILIDEIGHIAFNRLVMTPRGLRLGGTLAHQTVRAMAWMTPELAAMGFTLNLEQSFAEFDLDDLPEEARSRGFFA
jgi:hypothetical protein